MSAPTSATGVASNPSLQRVPTFSRASDTPPPSSVSPQGSGQKIGSLHSDGKCRGEVLEFQRLVVI
eukprot:7861796-Prorocentrum_lima.AAC.1